jgi:tetratricopeptide (TPR) repeat protein
MRADRVVLALVTSVLLFPSPSAARPKRGAGLHRRHRAAATGSRPDPASVAPTNDASVPSTEVTRAFQTSYEREAAGRYGEALTALDALPAGERGAYLATLRRGWLLHLAGREAESSAAYAKARDLEQDSVEARVGSLLPAMALGRWGEVQATAKAALALEPGNYLASLRLAFATFNLGRFAEAESLYRKLLARYPSDADVRAGLAFCLAKQGKRSEAKRELQQALASAPRSPMIASGLRSLAEVHE